MCYIKNPKRVNDITVLSRDKSIAVYLLFTCNINHYYLYYSFIFLNNLRARHHGKNHSLPRGCVSLDGWRTEIRQHRRAVWLGDNLLCNSNHLPAGKQLKLLIQLTRLYLLIHVQFLNKFEPFMFIDATLFESSG